MVLSFVTLTANGCMNFCTGRHDDCAAIRLLQDMCRLDSDETQVVQMARPSIGRYVSGPSSAERRSEAADMHASQDGGNSTECHLKQLKAAS